MMTVAQDQVMYRVTSPSGEAAGLVVEGLLVAEAAEFLTWAVGENASEVIGFLRDQGCMVEEMK
jgi:hypothetical protein